LDAEIVRRLRYFGIEEDGTFLDRYQLSHLAKEDLEIRKKLEEAIEKEKAGGLTTKQAVQRYIRHVSFTYLNRLAALRAMEVRKLITETIIRRPQYGGRSLRERNIVESNPRLTSDQSLKECLLEAFREVSNEIKVLFDPENEYSLVFPETTTLREIIRLLTEEVTEQDWKEDDIIGWIYQYYNEDARREYRQSRRKPTPDDIPIINQFYTPHWIVKALVDNTLGRLWLEMHPGSKLGEFCTYLVPSKNGQNKREVKKVREIKVLDPACGSGHFLVYAFDVLYQMYQDDEPNTPTSEIPSLILENNLFGIDIDLYSVQLAALSLYLKAKFYNPSLKIRKMNLVCADIRISDSGKRREFLHRFRDDPDLQRIFERLFEDLGYTYEIGSLLKVRQPFERLFKERKLGEKQARFALYGQTQLSRKGLVGQTKFLVEPSTSSKPNFMMVIPKERTIEEMLGELREFEQEAIEAQDMGRLLFATEVEKSVGLLALLSEKYDVVLMNPPYGDMPAKTKEYLRKYYPKTHFDYYAAFIEQTIDLAQDRGYVGAITGRTFMFLRWYQWVRQVLFKERAPLQLVWDLGFGVLDVAIARWAAFTAQKGHGEKQQKTIFIRLIEYANEPEKKGAWEEVIEAMRSGKAHRLLFEIPMAELAKIPSMPYSYWSSATIRSIFSKYPPLDRDLARRQDQPKIADVKQGLATGDDIRFTRLWWEVPTTLIATNRQETSQRKKWVPYANDVYLYYYFADVQSLVNWENDGEELRNYRSPTGKLMSRAQNIDFFFRGGLSWSVSLQRSQLNKVKSIGRIPFRILPQGSIFGVAAQGVLIENEKRWALLAICCSKLIYYLSRLVTPDKMTGTGSTASFPIASLDLLDPRVKKLDFLAHEAHNLLREWTTGEEVSTLFIKPWILQVLYGFNAVEKPVTQHPLAKQFEWSDWPSAKQIRSLKRSQEISLKTLAELCVKQQLMLNKRIEEIQKDIDEDVYSIYGISDEDKALIERELTLQKIASLEEESGEALSEEIEGPSKDVISTREHVERLISYYVKKAIESDEDGIVPLDEMFPDYLASQVRQQIISDFGKANLDKIEKELEKILGKTLSDWLAEDFFNFHVTLYRRRPIFWQLTSNQFGSGRSHQGVFSCFLYYHKLTKETIPTVQALYLHKVRERLQREKDFISNELVAASGDRKKELQLKQQYAQISEKLNELEKFDTALTELQKPRRIKTKLSKDSKWIERKIAEVRDEGWKPVIDYGVRVNIEPLKELGLLSKAADRIR